MRNYQTRLLMLSLLLFAGCGYNAISPTAYDFATSLYSISNRQLPDRLHESKVKIEEAQANGQITAREAGWLHAIIKHAEQGRWKRAMQSARKIMDSQVSYQS